MGQNLAETIDPPKRITFLGLAKGKEDYARTTSVIALPEAAALASAQGWRGGDVVGKLHR